MSAYTVAKAIAGAISTGLGVSMLAIVDGDKPIICALAGLAAACGGFAGVYIAPRNANTRRVP